MDLITSRKNNSSATPSAESFGEHVRAVAPGGRGCKSIRARSRLMKLWSGLLVLAATGCATHYTPSPSRPMEAIPEFSSSGQVALKNAQLSTADVLFFDGPRNWYGNLNKWTDVAITIAARELKNRGMEITDGAPRELRMSIESAKTETHFATVDTVITMRVETGDGYAATYVARNASGFVAIVQRQVDGAVMRAVVEMFRDPKVVAYLTQ